MAGDNDGAGARPVDKAGRPAPEAPANPEQVLEALGAHEGVEALGGAVPRLGGDAGVDPGVGEHEVAPGDPRDHVRGQRGHPVEQVDQLLAAKRLQPVERGRGPVERPDVHVGVVVGLLARRPLAGACDAGESPQHHELVVSRKGVRARQRLHQPHDTHRVRPAVHHVAQHEQGVVRAKRDALEYAVQSPQVPVRVRYHVNGHAARQAPRSSATTASPMPLVESASSPGAAMSIVRMPRSSTASTARSMADASSGRFKL